MRTTTLNTTLSTENMPLAALALNASQSKLDASHHQTNMLKANDSTSDLQDAYLI